VRNERPGNGAGDCRLEDLCEAATATEPCESSFDDPSAGQNFEAPGRVGTFDGLYRPFADTLERLPQLIAGVTTIGEDVAQPGTAQADRSKDAGGVIAILNAGFVHHQSNQVALGVGNNVVLAALDLSARSSLSLFPASKPRGQALSVVSPTGCQYSNTPAVGLASRQSLARRHDESVVQ
jgi:hypothetical protein